MKEIQLTKNQVALVDDEDCDYINQWKWWALPALNGGFYAVRNSYEQGVRTFLYMHRVILNAPQGMVVDHRNQNSLDNRRSNIRLCTIAENNRNRKLLRNNTTGYTGIRFRNGHWWARIEVNGVEINAKFKNQIDAVRKYDELAREHFGEFANVNVVG